MIDKIWGILILAFAVFILLPVFIGIGLDRYCYDEIKNKSHAFVDSSRANGKIDEAELFRLYHELGVYGATDVTLGYEKSVVYSDEKGIHSEMIRMDEKELIAQITGSAHCLLMDSGDALYITVRRVDFYMFGRFLRFFTGHMESLAVNEYGGVLA